jgi:HEAT repeat protein
MIEDSNVLQTLVQKMGADDTATRQQAINALSQRHLTPSLVDQLLAALSEQRSPLRINAVQMLSRSEDFRVVPPVVQRLKDDSDALVRVQAALALGRLKDRSAINPLQMALRNDNDWTVRRAAAEALKSFTSDEVVQSLLDALNDQTEAVASEAATSLQEKSKQDTATAILVQQLDAAPLDDHKLNIVNKLTMLESPKTARLFMDLLADGDAQIRILAARFLGTMGWKLVKPDQWKTVEILTDVLEIDPDNDVRLEAVFAVGHFKSMQSRTALILALDDESPIVAEIARGWLKEFGYDPEIFGKACVRCGRSQQDIDIPFKACLACGKVVCEDDWVMHTLGGPFCSETCQSEHLQDVDGR